MQTAIYQGVTAPRWGKEEREWIDAKSHPPYVYSTSRNACLVHKIVRVKLRWWKCTWDCMVRLQHPRMIAESACGMNFFIDSTKAKTCAVPRPDAVLCGRCHGEGPSFPKWRKPKISRDLAKVRLGCVSEGEAA